MTTVVPKESFATQGPLAAKERSEFGGAMILNYDNLDDAGAAVRIRDEIVRLGLEPNIVELELFGYTVVEPERVAPPGFAKQVLDTVLRIATEESGVVPDLETGSSHIGLSSRGQDLWMLVKADPIFEQLLMNEVSLALVTYLLGEHCLLSTMSAGIKGPSDQPVFIHADSHTTQPFPFYPQVCNATWALTDYTVENGCLTMVPATHRYCRVAKPGEGVDQQVPIETPAGSLIVWHGNTWHGALPRTAPGLRVNLLQTFARPHLAIVEDNRDIDPAIIERNPPRFAALLGHWLPFNNKDGLDYSKAAGVMNRLHAFYG